MSHEKTNKKEKWSAQRLLFHCLQSRQTRTYYYYSLHVYIYMCTMYIRHFVLVRITCHAGNLGNLPCLNNHY